MYHTFFVILLSVCFAPACEGQVQSPAASAEPLRGAESAPTEVPGEIKVFVLKSAPSIVIVNMLKELIPERTMRIIADDRTNSIIVTGTADQLLAVEALLSKLDGADQNIVVAKHVADTVALIQELRELQLRHGSEHPSVRKIRDRLAAEANSLATLNTRPGATSKPVTPATNNSSNDLQKELAQLRIEYDATNKHAHELAESIRKTPLDAKKAELRTAVQRSFTLRQSLLRAELLEMQTRLLQTQQSLDMRERVADQIVDRRVEDLLNPQLKWEDGTASDQPLKQSVSPYSPAIRIPAADPKAATLATLQGAWVLDGKLDGDQIKVEIRDNVMTWSVDLPLEPGDGKPPIFMIKLGEPGTPQTVDLTMNPNDGPERKELLGIVEIGDDLVRFCVNNDDSGLRPEVFAFGKAADLWTLRRPAKQLPANSGAQLAPAPVRNPPEPALPTTVTVNFHARHDEQFSVGEIVDVEANYPNRLGEFVAVKLLARLVVTAIHVDTASSRMTDIELTANDMQAYLLQGMMKQAPEYLKLVKHSPNDNAFIGSYGFNSAACMAFIVDAVANSALLAKLQGNWDMHMISADPNPPGGREEAVIEGDLMTITITLDGETVTMPVQLKLDGSPELYEMLVDGKAMVGRRRHKSTPAGSPQPIDLIHFPNDEQERTVLPGIIEFREDSVHICLANSSDPRRPEVFAVGKDADIWELRRKPAASAMTEIEGDWHLVSIIDKHGTSLEDFKPVNMGFRNDRYTVTQQAGHRELRVEIDPDTNEIRYFEDGDLSFQNRYLLQGDQLTIYNENIRKVYQRGHVALPKSIRKVTEEQTSRWRWGIVEILTRQEQDSTQKTERIGHGVIVSPQTRIVAQVRAFGSDCSFFAKFYDGDIVPIKILEQGPGGFFTFETKSPIEAKHYFRLSEETLVEGSEVHMWGRAADDRETQPLELFKATVDALDIKYFHGSTFWRLSLNADFRESLPVLDSNGDLLAITLVNTKQLAVPVSQLKVIFPKTSPP